MPPRTRRHQRVIGAAIASLAMVAGGASAAVAAARPGGRAGSALQGVSRLVHGYEGYCALVAGGHIECWGDNAYGELGAGITAASSNLPVAVKGLSGATSLVSGYEGYCALVSDGHVKCWGDNSYGELGANSAATSSNVPVPVG